MSVLIDGQDKSNLVLLNSFEVQNVLTQQVDTARFTMLEKPAVGADVQVLGPVTPYQAAAPTFSRTSTAYLSDGTLVQAGQPRLEGGALWVEEGTTNKIETEGAASQNWQNWSHWGNRTYWYSETQYDDPVIGKVFQGVAKPTTYLFDYYPYSVTSGTAYTFSIWLKASQQINLSSMRFYVVSSVGGLHTIASTESADKTITTEWKKFYAVLTPSETCTGTAGIGIGSLAVPDGVTIYAARPQLEQKGYATSFYNGTRATESFTFPWDYRGGWFCWELFVRAGQKRSELNNWIPLIRATKGSDYIEIGYRGDRGSKAIYTVFYQGGQWQEGYGYTIDFVAGDWLYLSLSFDGTRATTGLARVGDQIGYTSFTPTVVNSGSYTIYLNRNSLGTWQFGDVRISSRQRSRAEIAAAYAGGQPLPVDGDTVYKLDFDSDLTAMTGRGKVFAGIVERVSEEYISQDKLQYSVDCVDYSRHLDRQLVTEHYQGQTAGAIVQDILTRYCPEFTAGTIDQGITIENISFDYKFPSDCLKTLANLCGNDWYVDYDKRVHFIATENNLAPFNFDNPANYTSLRVDIDLSQLRNRVYLRGGTMLSDNQTETFTGTGSQAIFYTRYRPRAALINGQEKLVITVNGQAKSVGINGITDPATVDVIVSYDDKTFTFRTPPANGDVVAITYRYEMPILVCVDDLSSQTVFGVYEHVLTDSGIKDRETAYRMAQAELAQYANPLVTAQATTYRDNLRSGQVITVTDALRGINQQFLITRVTARTIDGQTLIYTVDMARRYFGLEDLLLELKRKTSDTNLSTSSIIDRLYAANDVIVVPAITDSCTYNLHQYLLCNTSTICGPAVLI